MEKQNLRLRIPTASTPTLSYQSLWGISGVGNLYQPGVSGGVAPTYTRVERRQHLQPAESMGARVGIAYAASDA